jgi:hypothetical protein
VRAIYNTRLYSRIKKLTDEELILKEIGQVRFLIKMAYFKLSEATEKELVESAVLELRSLEIKHAYLLNKLKKEQNKK